MALHDLNLKTFFGPNLFCALVALSSISPCEAFFRNMMIGDTAMARVDPIVSIGGPAAHVHHLTGGGNLDFDSTGETLSASSCTNSILTQDKSAYWAPWLYFQHANGSFEDVKLALGLTAYYKYETRLNTGGQVSYSVFPKGLKMISGDTKKRNWTGPWPVPEESWWGPDDVTQAALAEKAMGFNCMNYEAGKNEPTFAYPYMRSKDFLDQNCVDGIRAEIIFPSCWDGKNLDSSDHKSHLAFPTLIQDGVCPETHPVYLPILFFETIWETNQFKDVPGQFVFANGDATGYGYHADFIAAWDDGVQEQVRDNPLCTSLLSDGQVTSCPVFAGKIQSQSDAAACKLKLPNAVADELTEGVLDKLPGDVQVVGSRHDPGTQPENGSYEPSTSVPDGRPSASLTGIATSTTGYYQSAVSSPSSTTMATSFSAALPATPSTTTTTYTSGRYVVELVVVQKYTTVTATSAPTMTQTVVTNKTEDSWSAYKSRKRQHLHQHARKHDLH